MRKRLITLFFIIFLAIIFIFFNMANGSAKNENNKKTMGNIDKKTVQTQKNQDMNKKKSESKKTAEAVKKPQTMIITMTGDTSVASFYGKKIPFDTVFRQNGAGYFLKGLEHYFKKADINITNLENVFTNKSAYQKGKIYTYKSYSNDYLDILTHNNIRYVNVVNNHMHDYLQAGFDDTLKILDEKKINYFGTNLVDSGLPELGGVKVHKTQVFEKGDIKLGLLGYYAFDSTHPSDATIKSDIKELKDKGCNFIIASMHGGGQEDNIVLDRQVIMARKFIDFGADMVYGHHPHALQKIEDYKGKKIYYSLGNFLFVNYRGSKNPEALLVELTLNMDEDGKITPKYKNVPILWMGDMYSNKYTPIEVKDKNVINKINKILQVK